MVSFARRPNYLATKAYLIQQGLEDGISPLLAVRGWPDATQQPERVGHVRPGRLHAHEQIHQQRMIGFAEVEAGQADLSSHRLERGPINREYSRRHARLPSPRARTLARRPARYSCS